MEFTKVLKRYRVASLCDFTFSAFDVSEFPNSSTVDACCFGKTTEVILKRFLPECVCATAIY